MKSLLLMGLLSVPAFALAPVAPANAADEAPKRVFIEASLVYNDGAPVKFSNPMVSGGRFEVKALGIPVRTMMESTCGEGVCEEVWKEQHVGQTLAISPTVLADGKIQIKTEFTDRQATPNLRILDTPGVLMAQSRTYVFENGVQQTIDVLDQLRVIAVGGKGSGAKLELTAKVME